MNNDELIEKAASVISTRKVGDRLFGDVGAALITNKGNVYTGVCLDTSGIGFCAEQSAVAAMTTAGEITVEKIVATWKDENDNLFVIAPCGHCREFMRQTNGGKMDIEIVLTKEKTVKLSELLPYRDSWERV